MILLFFLGCLVPIDVNACAAACARHGMKYVAPGECVCNGDDMKVEE